MSYQVLVIPEDPTHNGDILEPLVGRMLAACGKPKARVLVLANTKVQGYEHARQKLPEILDRYRHFDLALFLVDADGKNRTAAFNTLEAKAEANGGSLICAAAEQEVEVWLLAGHVEKLGIPWRKVREDVSVKENVFEPFLAQYGDPRRYGGGRDLLMKQGLARYEQILAAMPRASKPAEPNYCARRASWVNQANADRHIAQATGEPIATMTLPRTAIAKIIGKHPTGTRTPNINR